MEAGVGWRSRRPRVFSRTGGQGPGSRSVRLQMDCRWENGEVQYLGIGLEPRGVMIKKNPEHRAATILKLMGVDPFIHFQWSSRHQCSRYFL